LATAALAAVGALDDGVLDPAGVLDVLLLPHPAIAPALRSTTSTAERLLTNFMSAPFDWEARG
jgi:hypothetical protein